ncbi:hypothetical protein P171DRAFT_428359, partial [Karstenula rhodostoma CBS 690.94]
MVEQETWARLATFRRQYFQLVDPPQLRWLEGRVLKDPEVQTWMFSHLFDAEKSSTLPPDRYRLRVLKVLVSKLEKAIDDPDEDVRASFSFFFAGQRNRNIRTSVSEGTPFCRPVFCPSTMLPRQFAITLFTAHITDLCIFSY